MWLFNVFHWLVRMSLWAQWTLRGPLTLQLMWETAPTCGVKTIYIEGVKQTTVFRVLSSIKHAYMYALVLNLKWLTHSAFKHFISRMQCCYCIWVSRVLFSHLSISGFIPLPDFTLNYYNSYLLSWQEMYYFRVMWLWVLDIFVYFYVFFSQRNSCWSFAAIYWRPTGGWIKVNIYNNKLSLKWWVCFSNITHNCVFTHFHIWFVTNTALSQSESWRQWHQLSSRGQ